MYVDKNCTLCYGSSVCFCHSCIVLEWFLPHRNPIFLLYWYKICGTVFMKRTTQSTKLWQKHYTAIELHK